MMAGVVAPRKRRLGCAVVGGWAVILAVIPPGTTRKTGGVQMDGKVNLTSEDDTRRHPLDGDEPTHNRSVAGSRPASPTDLVSKPCRSE
jgi:hypothetical protein